MELSRKRELFERVRKDVEGVKVEVQCSSLEYHDAIDAKCVEELRELRYEVKSIEGKICDGEEVTRHDIEEFIDEVADVFNTLEQKSGIHNLVELLTGRIDFKLERLCTYADDGKLLKKMCIV